MEPSRPAVKRRTLDMYIGVATYHANREAHMLILTAEGGTHQGHPALGVGSNEKKRERAARLALAALALRTHAIVNFPGRGSCNSIGH